MPIAPSTTPSPGVLASPLSMVDWANQNRPAPEQKTDKLWYRNEEISGGNWNQLFPYQLVVVDQKSDGAYVQRMTPVGPFQFTLPVSPESFQLSMPFAINTAITLGGHIEEHNGAPLRVITIAGTTGVAFGRGRAPIPASFDFRTTIFAGTLQAATSTANSAVQLIHPTFTNNSHTQNEYDDTDLDGMGSLTGWYQWRLLQLFFESYSELKKTREGRNSRLAFATWKDEAVYLVTPMTYDVHKDTSSPLEYRYHIVFRAFKRVRLERGAADISQPYVPIQANPGRLARCLNALSQIRVVLQGAKKTIAAVGGDIQRGIFEPIRQTTLLIKDTLAVPLSIADLSDSVIQDTKAAIVNLISTKNAVSNFPRNANRRFQQVSANARTIDDNLRQLASETGDDTRTSAIVVANRDTHPANSPFTDPSDNYDFFSLIQVGNLNLAPSTMAKIAAERSRSRRLTRLDFQKMRDDAQASADAFAAAIGAGHATYNEIYGLEAPAETVIDSPTDDDFNTLFYLNQLVTELNRFVVTQNSDPKLNAIATVAGLATQAGIAFRIPRSKFAVPFPYKATLEQLAYQYLDDPNRWMEIAALNGLQAPYVDEEGFTLPLLVNGANNEVFVSSDEHLYVGQPVWISSDIVARTRRTVTKINQLSPTQFMVTVNGDADLDQYITPANARLEAFLPNTVNSQMIIYIPSDLEPKDGDFTTRTIPGIDEYDSMIAVGGIDLLLTPSNDLIVTPDGDSRWAVGLTNIVQKVRLALSVVQGTLNQHPDYGLPLHVGQSLADLSAAEVVRAAQGMFAGDPTFTGVKAASITINGPLANLNIAVQVAGTNQVIPISAEVTR